MQVCVQRHSATLAEACAGFRGLVDARGMRVDTPMPLLELSALLPVLGVHHLVAAGRAAYDAPLREAWPGCASAAKAGYTVGDALSQTQQSIERDERKRDFVRAQVDELRAGSSGKAKAR